MFKLCHLQISEVQFPAAGGGQLLKCVSTAGVWPQLQSHCYSYSYSYSYSPTAGVWEGAQLQPGSGWGKLNLCEIK